MQSEKNLIDSFNFGFIGNHPIDQDARDANHLPTAEIYQNQKATCLLRQIFPDSSIEIVNIHQPREVDNKLAVLVYHGYSDPLESQFLEYLDQVRFFLEAGNQPLQRITISSNPNRYLIIIRIKFYRELMSYAANGDFSFEHLLLQCCENLPSHNKKILKFKVSFCYAPRSTYSWGSGSEEILEDDPIVGEVISDKLNHLPILGSSAPCRLSTFFQRVSHCLNEPSHFQLEISQNQLKIPASEPYEKSENANWRSELLLRGHSISGLSQRGQLRMPEHHRLISLDSNYPYGFSILIPFYNHIELLKKCITSINNSVKSATPSPPLEVIIMNDDPRYQLSKDLFGNSQNHINITIVNSPINNGITKTLNEGIKHCSLKWVLFLDCDDQLTWDSLQTLHNYIQTRPHTNYISSNILDITESSTQEWFRARTQSQKDMFNGMFAGHFKCIQRDVFDQIGLLDPHYDGCQDFEFALRYCLFSQITFLPLYLYKYTWHKNTQSITKYNQARLTADNIRSFYLFVLQSMKERHIDLVSAPPEQILEIISELKTLISPNSTSFS